MARAYPHRRTLGVLLRETPWCWNRENSAHSAQAACEQDAFDSAHNTSIPDDYQAIEMTQFYWPISQGTSRAALAVVDKKDGDLYAQLVGMVRDGDTGYVPGEWTSINLTKLGLAPQYGPLAATTHHPTQCPNCMVPEGQPHGTYCEVARCLVTGQQRLMCTYFGGSLIAAQEAIHANSQEDDFETYFRTPAGHDCGLDTWHGTTRR